MSALPGGREDPSLVSAQEFLRLFNQICCSYNSSSGASRQQDIRDQRQQLLHTASSQDVMEVDDIVEEDL